MDEAPATSLASRNDFDPRRPGASAPRGGRLRRELFLREPTRALRLGLALVALVVLAAALVPARPLAADHHWAAWMSDVSTGALRHLALAFDQLGRGLGRALLPVAVGVVLAAGRRWRALLALAAAETLTPLAVGLLKQLAGRPRPANALLHAGGSSFPSGHAAY